MVDIRLACLRQKHMQVGAIFFLEPFDGLGFVGVTHFRQPRFHGHI